VIGAVRDPSARKEQVAYTAPESARGAIMVQESYADFSIVQKYIDQKKMFDEELIEYKQRISTLEARVKELEWAVTRRDKVIIQLKSYKEKVVELEEKMQAAHQKLSDKEAVIRQLNARLRSLAPNSSLPQE